MNHFSWSYACMCFCLGTWKVIKQLLCQLIRMCAICIGCEKLLHKTSSISSSWHWCGSVPHGWELTLIKLMVHSILWINHFIHQTFIKLNILVQMLHHYHQFQLLNLVKFNFGALPPIDLFINPDKRSKLWLYFGRQARTHFAHLSVLIIILSVKVLFSIINCLYWRLSGCILIIWTLWDVILWVWYVVIML